MLRLIGAGTLAITVASASLSARAVHERIDSWLATRRALLIEPRHAAERTCGRLPKFSAPCTMGLLWREDERWTSVCAPGPPPARDPRWAPPRWWRLTLACDLDLGPFGARPLRLLATTIFR